MGIFTKISRPRGALPPTPQLTPTAPHLANPGGPKTPFRNLGSAMTTPYPLGRYPPGSVCQARQQAQHCLAELAHFKKSPQLNANFQLVEKWLDTLHRWVDIGEIILTLLP